MTRLILTLGLLFAAVLSYAQTPTQRLERRVEGQGVVTLSQDQRLANLVDGVAPIVEASDKSDDFSVQTVLRKKKSGFRIQMYWGNAARADQQNAERIGNQVTAIYPELQAYVSFDTPHWRCRVGDFATREEAAKYLNRLRRIRSDAMIVKSEIFVFQEK